LPPAFGEEAPVFRHEERRRPPPHSPDTTGIVVVVVIFVLIAGMFGAAYLFPEIAPFLYPANARCPHCGREFYVPEVKSLDDSFRVHRCPNCGTRGAAGMLINEYEFHRLTSPYRRPP
jgi:hypothetical protein